MERPIVILSGGFDPYHDGHAAMFKAAAEIGDIFVIINSDEWLLRKKGKFFMRAEQRCKVLNSIRGVKYWRFSKSLSDVSGDIGYIKAHYPAKLMIFANGGDRTAKNTPEQEVCESLGIPIIYGLGGGKSNSSSDLLKRWVDIQNEEFEQLGEEVLDSSFVLHTEVRND